MKKNYFLNILKYKKNNNKIKVVKYMIYPIVPNLYV